MNNLLNRFILFLVLFFSFSGVAVAEGNQECLKVGFHQFPGIAVHDKEENMLSGLAADILEEVKQEIGKDICYAEYPDLKKIFPAVNAQEVDLMVGAFTITHQREKLVDFTVPYMISGSGILVMAHESTGISTIAQAIFTPVVGQAFLFFAGFLLTAGLILWFLERGDESGIPKNFLSGYVQACFCAFDLAISAGFGRVEPQKIIGRIVGIPVFIVGTIFVGTLIGSVTSALTLVEFEHSINSPIDLHHKAVATKSGSNNVDLLHKFEVNVIQVNTRDEAIEALTSGRADAVVYDAPFLKFIAAQNEELTVTHTFSPYYYGFAVPPGSTLREEINAVLLKMQHNGKLDTLTKRYFAD